MFRYATVLSIALAGVAFAGDTTEPERPVFAEPVQLTAGGELIKNRYYPTPVLQDLDGDGKAELVVGDLQGRFWISKRTDKDTAWTRPVQMLAQGKPLKLKNW